MRFWLFIVCIVVAFNVESKTKVDKEPILQFIVRLNELNSQLNSIENEEAINPLLEQKNTILNDLILALQNTKLEKIPDIIDKSELNFLNSRININKKNKNNLAVKRDQIKLEFYHIDQQLRDYLSYLIKSSHEYTSATDIVTHSEQILSTLSKKEEYANGIPQELEISKQLIKNSKDYQILQTTYQDILNFVITNPEKITETHWFKRLTLNAAIASINTFSWVKPANRFLSPFNIDLGGILISLVIVVLIFFWYPVIRRSCDWLLEKKVLIAPTEYSDTLYREIHRPILYLLLFFSIDMATYALLYRTEYKASFEHFAFIVYALLFLWLIFKLLDAILYVQINRLSQTKKDLRKELFHLGFQLLKGVVTLAILAITLNHFGISITAIMSTLGIGGLAFALAAKDTLSNLFGGVVILIDNTFRMGDWITIGEEEGTVVEVGLRTTTIRTFDNALITIPNSVISVSTVRNWNRRAVGRRIKMHIGVTYESNMDDLRKALDDIRTMLREHPDIANPKEKYKKVARRYRLSSIEDTQGIKATQLVYFDRYGDFSMDILIYCFAKTVKWEEWLRVKEDVLFRIAEIIRRNNLDFAYPTQVRILREEHIDSDNLTESI